MIMNRRGFLTAIGATATGLVLPEPRRVYSFPSARWLERRRRRVLPGVTFTVRVDRTFLDGLERDRIRAELERDVFGALVSSGGSLEHVKEVIQQRLDQHQRRVFGAGLRGVVISGKVSV